MRKFLLIFISVLMLFPLSSCGYNESTDTHSEVVINLPSDNTLNGYRTESSEAETATGEMPDKISVDQTRPGSGGPRRRQAAMLGTKRLMFSINQAVPQ